MVVKPGKKSKTTIPDTVQLHISAASLGAEVQDGRNVLMVKQDDMDSEFALCSLTAAKLECTPLDLYFRDETVTFSVAGQSEIHLSGHVIDDEGGDDEDSEEDSDDDEVNQNGAASRHMTRFMR